MMTRRTCLKDFARYTSLNVLGMLGLSCYILADTFFVSKALGANGLTALNLAIPVYSFIHGSGLMLGMGGATKYGILKGQGNGGASQTNHVFTHTVCMAGVLAVIFTFIGLFFSQPLARLLGADSDVFSMANTYLKIIMLFSTAFIMNDILICFVRNDGNPRLSMLAMLTGSLSNILLDYIFMFPLGMGIFGAVLATGLAPIISMAILSRHLLNKQNNFRFIKIKPHFTIVKSIVSMGLPSLVTEVSSGVVMIIFNALILGLQGNTGVAAYGVVANLSLVVIAIYTGIAQGIQPLLSRAFGGNDIRTIRRVLRYALFAMLAVSVCIYGGIFWGANSIAGIFNSQGNAQLQETAVSGLRLYFLAAPFAGFNIIISMFFTAISRAIPAHILSLCRGFLLIIPMAFILAYLTGLIGVWLAFPAAEAITAVLACVLYGCRRPHRL